MALTIRYGRRTSLNGISKHAPYVRHRRSGKLPKRSAMHDYTAEKKRNSMKYGRRYGEK